MILELHNVTIGQQIRSLSMTVESGQLVGISGAQGSGKTTLVRAILGFIPVDNGHISIDGELLTPRSAPWFRKQMAYVPQHLSVPDGYDMDTDYLHLVERAVRSGKALMIVDEPEQPLSESEQEAVDRLLHEAAEKGSIVLAVNPRITENQIAL